MRIIQNRRVPDPMMTDAEFLHRMSEEIERAERSSRKPDPYVGKVWVTENAMTRIGALCFIRDRQDHHERAAEVFKSTYEARYGEGNPAIDASRVRVDTSIMAHDSGMAAKLDRTWRIEQVKGKLGKEAFDRLVAVIVLGIPCGEGLHWRSRKAAIAALLDDLGSLSTIWRLMPAAA